MPRYQKQQQRWFNYNMYVKLMWNNTEHAVASRKVVLSSIRQYNCVQSQAAASSGRSPILMCRRQIPCINSQVPSQRWFSNTNTKRRRRHRKLRQTQTSPETTRQRIRWLQDHNQMLATSASRKRQQRDQWVEDLGDTAEARLLYIRDKIYDFWRGPPPNSKGTSLQQQQQRPKRLGPNMNAKWWFWQIAFALLPATIIVAYCELIGKPQMFTANRLSRIQQQRQLLGDDYCQEKDEELARLQAMEQEAFVTKLYQALSDLTAMFLGNFRPSATKEEVPATVVAKEDQPSATSKNGEKDNAAASNISKEVEDDDRKAIAELKERLAQLEHRLKQRDSSSTPNQAQSTTMKQSQTQIMSPIQQRVLQQQRKQEAARHDQRQKDVAASHHHDGPPNNQSWLESMQQYFPAWFSSNNENTKVVDGTSSVERGNQTTQKGPFQASNKNFDQDPKPASSTPPKSSTTTSSTKDAISETSASKPTTGEATAPAQPSEVSDSTTEDEESPKQRAYGYKSWWRSLWGKSGN